VLVREVAACLQMSQNMATSSGRLSAFQRPA
jgi:hypothetical protein